MVHDQMKEEQIVRYFNSHLPIHSFESKSKIDFVTYTYAK